MIGQKCDCCGDEVFIIRTILLQKLCLDCYEKQNTTYTNESQQNPMMASSTHSNACIHTNVNKGIRYCIKCGRSIPFESIICPYCLHRFQTY